MHNNNNNNSSRYTAEQMISLLRAMYSSVRDQRQAETYAGVLSAFLHLLFAARFILDNNVDDECIGQCLQQVHHIKMYFVYNMLLIMLYYS